MKRRMSVSRSCCVGGGCPEGYVTAFSDTFGSTMDDEWTILQGSPAVSGGVLNMSSNPPSSEDSIYHHFGVDINSVTEFSFEFDWDLISSDDTATNEFIFNIQDGTPSSIYVGITHNLKTGEITAGGGLPFAVTYNSGYNTTKIVFDNPTDLGTGFTRFDAEFFLNASSIATRQFHLLHAQWCDLTAVFLVNGSQSGRVNDYDIDNYVFTSDSD